MPEALIQQSQSEMKREERPAQAWQHASTDFSSFKYYIHDSITTLRLQLIGDLQSRHVTELNGSWETAKTTLAGRPLVLDLSKLRNVDETGQDWLRAMNRKGAVMVPADYLDSFAQHGAAEFMAPVRKTKLSLLDRLAAIVRGISTTKCS